MADPQLTRDPSSLKTLIDLKKAGFTDGQAEGVMAARGLSPGGKASLAGTHSAYGAVDLRAAGFSPSQLLEAGYAPRILKEAGFTPVQLGNALSNVSCVRMVQAGFTAEELLQMGYSVDDLKKAGFKPARLRKEGKLSLEDLKAAGFTPNDLRSEGFGPGELLQAGFALGEIKQAGYTASALAKKAGFTLEQLKDAGYGIKELADAGASAVVLKALGFEKKEIQAAGVGGSGGTPARPASPGGDALLDPPLDGGSLLSSARADPSMLQAILEQERKAAAERAAKKAHAAMQMAAPIAFPEKKQKTLADLYATPPAKQVTGPSGTTYGPGLAFCCLRVATQPRRLCIHLAESPCFEPIILTFILANCITMAWSSPLDPPDSPKASLLAMFEWVFLYAFTCEMCIKMVAKGLLFTKNSYLLDPWCQLDFAVVSLGWLPYLTTMNVANMSVLRSFRALRPLRALKRVPGMPLLVESILGVLPKMAGVCTLCGFIFLVFGIVGLELFKGDFHYRCAEPGFTESPDHPFLPGRRRLSEGVDQSDYDTETFCDPHAPKPSDVCEAGQTCGYFDADGLGNGLTSFDNIGVAFVVLLQCVTFDDWATPMYALIGAGTEPPALVIVFFALIVFLGGFFVVNLFLAVIFEEFLQQKTLDQTIENVEEMVVAAESERGGSPTKAAASSEGEGAPLIPNGQSRSDGVDGAPPSPLALKIDPERQLRKGLAPAPAEDAGNILTVIAKSSALNNTATSLVVINLILMCLPFYGMSDEYKGRLEGATSLITLLFILEMATKIVGLGWKGYWSDQWNVLDGSIVLLSIAELLVTDVLYFLEDGTVPNLSFLRVLRMLRLMRMLRLLKSWRGLYKILSTFIKAVKSTISLLILMFLIMFIFALVGIQLFGGKYNPSTGFSDVPCPGGECPDGELEPLPHYHFDYFGPAMGTVFCLMTGEWIDLMEPATAAVGPAASIYFIVCVVVGFFLMMNLFIGILLNSFADDEEEEEENSTSGGGGGGDDGEDGAPAPAPAASERVSTMAVVELPPGEDPIWPRDYSLFLFSPRHPLRRCCVSIITLDAFDQFIILMIIASTFCLALDSPRLDPESALGTTLRSLDVVWTVLFAFEATTKIIGLGFCNYLSSAWNRLDLFIVLASVGVLMAEWMPQVFGPDSTQFLRQLRLLRVLRPLRLIQRNPGMKLIVSSLLKALPMVTDVAAVVLMLQAVFAILGMQLFMGKLGSCTNPAILTQAECHETSHAHLSSIGGDTALATDVRVRMLKGGGDVHTQTYDGEEAVRWVTPGYGSFDDFGSAMRLLYVMASGDEWEAPMYAMQAATEVGLAPVRNDYDATGAIYSITWMFLGAFFALNLVVGAICDTFDKIKKETDQSATLTPEQQQWVKTMSAIMRQTPSKGFREPNNFVLKLLYQMVTSQIFDAVITAVILANIGVMACDYWGIEHDEEAITLYKDAMRTFVYIYYVEATVKILALGINGYFSDGWCRFDFFLVSITIVDQLAADKLQQILPLPPTMLRVLRIFRILRILRLLKGAKELRDLIVTMFLSFPSLINVGSLLVIVVFMYAVIGLNLFTYLTHGEMIDEVRNFETLSNAGLLLFQCLTGDAWSGLMTDAMLDEGSGLCSDDEGTCGTWLAIPYFITFQVIACFVFLNLIVAVILENFSSLGNMSPDLVSANDVEAFRDAWAVFDPDADNFIPSSDLPDLVLSLTPPLGIKGVKTDPATSRQLAVKMCLRLSLKQEKGLVAFSEVLNALTKFNFFQKVDPKDVEALPGVPAAAPANAPPELPMHKIASFKKASSSDADKFAEDMPSIRRVFALGIIDKHAHNWRGKIADRDSASKAAMLGANGVNTLPLPGASSSPPPKESKRAAGGGSSSKRNKGGGTTPTKRSKMQQGPAAASNRTPGRGSSPASRRS